MFDMFDLNQDGKISVVELKSMFGQKSALNSPMYGEKLISEVMKEVDKNNDGFIDYEEFNEAVTHFLSK